MKTLHVVGYKNSGKTTLIAHWITVLQRLGLEVAVLKHHGHGGAPDLPPAQTDTVQFLVAGAVSTVVAGGGMLQLIQQKEPSFQELKALAASSGPDVLLIEGYKQEVGEKVVLLRNEEDRATLESLQGVIKIADTHALFSDGTLLDNWLQQWMEEAQ
ncbi:molybdopterin-guanine dinucleotide biosynthesis protein B [Sporosarcina sp. P13]|uniref:molybdopterin-guanine dinucleotide biosynthesis protein B n=1 Tax=Sporosarcina sp. P13 TaxID=2048263 RepID=UPI000C172DB6|nr:molybdopterin-guanine dinucleotide biosynthesis protein B [Sporosarcina sp. P13]PIC64781.1 molybdopterin-guanine dinucleotide biosynthesis protein B [Sporosarcina sp. P13]